MSLGAINVIFLITLELQKERIMDACGWWHHYAAYIIIEKNDKNLNIHEAVRTDVIENKFTQFNIAQANHPITAMRKITYI